MFLLRICRKCETYLKTQAQMRGASTRAKPALKGNNQVLKKLGFAPRDYKKVIPKIRTIRELNLQRVLDKLTRLGFTHEDIRKQPNAMKLHPFLIDHRFKLLEESGIEKKKITLAHISKFARLTKTVISELKKRALLNENTDVVHSILRFSNLPLELYPPKTRDDEFLGKAQTAALQTFISWKLGLTREEVNKKYQSYEHLCNKSIRLVMESYDVLTNQLKLPQNKITQNMYLLEGHPDNFLEILERIPQLADTPIQHIALIRPKILARPVYKMLKIIDVLKKYNLTEEKIAVYPEILTLSPETVNERAASLYADPVFHPFFSSPRICFLIYRYHTSISRYRLLSSLKWRCLSIQMLTSNAKPFQKRIELGHDESWTSDVPFYLKKHLGYELKEIRQQLRLHPFHMLISLQMVSATLQMLLMNGCNKHDIFKALPIVLYPKEKVARWLEQVHQQPEVHQLLGANGQVPPSLVLHLVLYYMERTYRFSGHGIWSEQDTTNTLCDLK